MSGPKSSRYLLEAARRLQIEQERRRRMEQEAAERRRQQEIAELRGSITSRGSAYTLPDALMRQCSEVAGKAVSVLGGAAQPAEAVNCQIRQLESELRGAVDRAGTTEDIAALKTIMDEVQAKLAALHKAEQRLREIGEQDLTALRIHFGDAAAAGTVDFSDAARPEQRQLEAQKQQLRARLQALREMPVSEALVQETASAEERLSALPDEEAVRMFAELTMQPLKKRCENFVQCRGEYLDLHARYLAAGGDPEAAFPCDPDGILRMKAALEAAELAAQQAEEQRYIRQCVDEVMREMGYDVLGGREYTRRSGRHVRNQLVRYDAETAVCITQTDDGQITMELGGLDTVDRAPDSAEQQMLCGKMEQFCDSFAEIERRLREKGVISEHISMLPPDAAHAQIINCTDFDIAMPETAAETVQHTQKKRKADQAT